MSCISFSPSNAALIIPERLMTDSTPSDMAAFAGEIQQLATQGKFDPFSLLAGETTFHSVFLAPLSPALAEAIRRFLADGDGPLRDVVGQFQTQGLTAVDATARVRDMFAAAKGVLVVVLAGDHSVMTVPQLFFGILDESMRRQAVDACGKDFPFRDQLAVALAELDSKARRGQTGPALIAGPQAKGRYWITLGEHLLASLDTGLNGRINERQIDLAHWIGLALESERLDDSGLTLAARCHLLAGNGARAIALLDRLLHDDADADALAELTVHLTDAACRHGQAREVGTWLSAFLPRFEQRFGTCYELRLAAFKIAAAAMALPDALVASAKRLMEANRKSARLDLTREPVWRVTVPVAAEDLLDTATAAALIGRDPGFIAKRLEQGAIPAVQQGEQVRIPRPALLAWQAVMKNCVGDG